MERCGAFLHSSQNFVEGKSEYPLGVNGNPIDLDRIANSFPFSKDGQEPSFEDVLKKAYGDFPKLKKHVDLHPSEYKNAIDLINKLPTQLQDKWRLLRLCLWYQYGSSIFGEIFNLTPDKTRKETALLSNLPDELTNMVPELFEESNEEEEIAGNITSESSSKRNNTGRVNPEKREFVILAEGGQKWKTLTNDQKLVLGERYLADHPDSIPSLAKRLRISNKRIGQDEAMGLRKLGFFGDAINLTRQQLQNIFKNATEEDINSLTPRERELLKRLYGVSIHNQDSYPTLKSAAADLKIYDNVAFIRHQNAMQKLLHTKSAIRIDTSFSPTSEQVEFMRQQIPLQGTYKVAKEIGVSQGIVRRWQRQGGIQLQRRGKQPMLPSPEVLEFIKTNYPNKSAHTIGTETGYSSNTIIRWLRDAGVPIRKKGRPQKITS